MLLPSELMEAAKILKTVTDATPAVAKLLGAVLDGDDDARDTVRSILPERGASQAAVEHIEKL